MLDQFGVGKRDPGRRQAIEPERAQVDEVYEHVDQDDRDRTRQPRDDAHHGARERPERGRHVHGLVAQARLAQAEAAHVQLQEVAAAGGSYY